MWRLDLIEEGAPKRSSLLLGNGEDDVKGGAGMPVNSWTMALKLVVSVVSTVVGARLDALDLFFGLRATCVWTCSAGVFANEEVETPPPPPPPRGGGCGAATIFSVPWRGNETGWVWGVKNGLIWWVEFDWDLDQPMSRLRSGFGFGFCCEREEMGGSK